MYKFSCIVKIVVKYYFFLNVILMLIEWFKGKNNLIFEQLVSKLRLYLLPFSINFLVFGL